MSRRRFMGNEKCTLTVYTTAGATVIVDGIIQTANSSGYAYYELKKGTYSYSASKSGYISRSGSVTVTSNQTLSIILSVSNILLLHFENNVTDASGNTSMSATSISYVTGKFGQAIRCGSTDQNYIQGRIQALGTSDFTIDFWIYRYSSVSYQKYAETGNDGTTGAFNIDAGSSGSNLRFYTIKSGNVVNITTSSTLPMSAWTHIAVVRHGNNWYMFINGSLVNSGYQTNIDLSATILTLRPTYTAIDEFRITKTAVWTSDFTPPVQPY